MERQRLIRIIDHKGTSAKEETNELWDIVRTFPYFQTARLLLAKSFHDQGSIHFHNELKVAAAYATDRKVLFKLIHQPAEPAYAQQDSNVFVLEPTQPVESSISAGESDNQFAISETKPDAPLFEIKQEIHPFTELKSVTVTPETHFREKQSSESADERPGNTLQPLIANDDVATTNEEIIRRRLDEILSKNKPEEKKMATDENKAILIPDFPQETESRPAEIVPEKATVTYTPPPIEENAPSVLDELPAEPHDIIEGLELETIIEENYLRELEKLPEIVPSGPRIQEEGLNKASENHLIEEELTAKPYSFIEWLKEKGVGYSTFEEVKDEPLSVDYNREGEITAPPSSNRETLIDKFIETKPRIVPTKTEFYSPANMARLSITDNEDIISETLARIYFDQQNYSKARSCYVKLGLLYPEKSASFAALIEKIDNILKEQT